MTALTIVAPQGKTLAQYYQQQTPVVGTIFHLKMLAAGGQTPYYWSFSGPAFNIVGSTTATNYALPFNGWLSCSPLAAGADTFTVLVTDNNGDTATQSVTITPTASGLTFYPLDLTYATPTINLPPGAAQTPYQYQFKVAGGTGINQVFSVVSGALPNGLSLSPAGLINGITAPGSIANCQVKCIDSGNNTQTVSLYLNVSSVNKVNRPAYNTSSAFFVDTGGFLRDPNGYLFTMRGLNRVHYDSDSWAGPASGGLAYPSVVRVFMFDGQTAAFAANQVQTQYIPNNIFCILTLAGLSGVGTSGDTNPATVTTAVNDWISYFSGLSPVMNNIAVNIANEWGPANSTVWRDTYITAVASLRSAGYTCPFVIDAANAGEDLPNILNYSVAINNSDPLKNCIFSIHPYAAALPWEASIFSVTKGNPTVLTLNSNWSLFPLNPGASNSTPPNNNNFNFEYQIIESAGLPSLNGIFPSDNKTYGSQNNWQVHLSVDSTLWPGNYIQNSAHIYLANSTSSRSVDYRYMCSLLAALRTSGVCTIVGEFGPGEQTGSVTGATHNLNFQYTTPGQFISACESYGLGWLPWAWDDHSGTNTSFAPDYFNMVLAVAPGYGKYTANNQLTAFGLDIVGNPRYGVPTLAQPAAIYLPVIFQLTDQAGNLLTDQGTTILTG